MLWGFFFVFLSIQACRFELSQCLIDEIDHLVQSNPSQMSLKEYSLIAETILAKIEERNLSSKGINILVFGVGRDSQLYLDLNPLGRVVFLEDNPLWIKKVKSSIPEIEICDVSYNTTLSDWKSLLTSKRETLLLDLPEELLNNHWDIILVDGPAGYDKTCPGRMKSIFTAAWLAKRSKDTYVFVHDIDRIVEKAYADRFLGKLNLVYSIDRMGCFLIDKSK